MKIKAAFCTVALVALLSAFAPAAVAKPSEFDLIARHIEKQYGAKKVSVPLLWLAKAVVHIAKPAGVKSFGVTLFTEPRFSFDTIDAEMLQAMSSCFGPEWSQVFHAHSRDGQQAYMYMRESGSDIKIAVVTVQRENAAVVRATISPDRLASFVSDPSIFGISLKDSDSPQPASAAGTGTDHE